MLNIILLILLGLLAGTLSGLIGIGGGVVIVPALIFLFGLTQLEAQGTTLAIFVIPVGILGALAYYKQGYIDLKITLLLCVGFFLGSLLGANVAFALPTKALSRIFGAIMLLVSLKMLFAK